MEKFPFFKKNIVLQNLSTVLNNKYTGQVSHNFIQLLHIPCIRTVENKISPFSKKSSVLKIFFPLCNIRPNNISFSKTQLKILQRYLKLLGAVINHYVVFIICLTHLSVTLYALSAWLVLLHPNEMPKGKQNNSWNLSVLLTNWHHRACEIVDYYLILKDFERPYYNFMGRE